MTESTLEELARSALGCLDRREKWRAEISRMRDVIKKEEAECTKHVNDLLEKGLRLGEPFVLDGDIYKLYEWTDWKEIQVVKADADISSS